MKLQIVQGHKAPDLNHRPTI